MFLLLPSPCTSSRRTHRPHTPTTAVVHSDPERQEGAPEEAHSSLSRGMGGSSIPAHEDALRWNPNIYMRDPVMERVRSSD